MAACSARAGLTLKRHRGPCRFRPAGFDAPPASAACSGLTLIELLLAITITVLLVAVVFSTYRTVQAVAVGQRQRVDTQQVPADAAELLQDDLMRLFDAGRPETRVVLTQALDQASASFCTLALPAGEADLRWSRALRVEWRALTDQGRLALGRSVQPLAGPGSLDPPVTNVVVADLARFGVSFYDGTNWSFAWPPSPSNAIPRAARLEILSARAATDQVWRLEVWIPAGSSFTSRLQRAASSVQR
jgi:type II secretory pathway component PulJ